MQEEKRERHTSMTPSQRAWPFLPFSLYLERERDHEDDPAVDRAEEDLGSKMHFPGSGASDEQGHVVFSVGSREREDHSDG